MVGSVSDSFAGALVVVAVLCIGLGAMGVIVIQRIRSADPTSAEAEAWRHFGTNEGIATVTFCLGLLTVAWPKHLPLWRVIVAIGAILGFLLWTWSQVSGLRVSLGRIRAERESDARNKAAGMALRRDEVFGAAEKRQSASTTTAPAAETDSAELQRRARFKSLLIADLRADLGQGNVFLAQLPRDNRRFTEWIAAVAAGDRVGAPLAPEAAQRWIDAVTQRLSGYPAYQQRFQRVTGMTYALLLGTGDSTTDRHAVLYQEMSERLAKLAQIISELDRDDN